MWKVSKKNADQISWKLHETKKRHCNNVQNKWTKNHKKIVDQVQVNYLLLIVYIYTFSNSQIFYTWNVFFNTDNSLRIYILSAPHFYDYAPQFSSHFLAENKNTCRVSIQIKL